MGLPILASKDAGSSKPRGLFVHFLSKREQPKGLKRPQYMTWLQGVTREFHALSDEYVSLLRAEVDQLHAEKQSTALDAVDPGDVVDRSGFMDNVVKAFGDDESPITKDVHDETVSAYMGVSEGDALPGFRRYEQVFRAAQLRNCFVEDEGAIESDEEFDYRLPLCLLAIAPSSMQLCPPVPPPPGPPLPFPPLPLLFRQPTRDRSFVSPGLSLLRARPALPPFSWLLYWRIR